MRSNTLALTALCLSMLMPSLDTSIANAGLPALAQAFSASFQQIQWIVLAYLLAITAFIVSAGRLGDMVGRRRLLMTGLGLFTAASLVCGIATDLWTLVAARAAQGLGAAAMMALTMALAGETVEKERIGRVMGLLGTMSAIGTTLGPSLGGVLTAAFGWPSIFLVNVPVGLLALFLAWRYLPEGRAAAKPERTRFDVAGTVLLAMLLGAYALSMTVGEGHFGGRNLVLLAAAAVGAAAFLAVEARAAAPLIQPGLLREAGLSPGLIMSVLVSTVMMATLVIGPFYLARGLGLPGALVGVALSAGPLVAALSGVPAGHMVDRFGARRMTMTGLSGMGAGAVILVLMPAAAGVAGYVLPIMTMTASYALFQAANNTQVMAGIAAERRGVVSGVLSLSRNLGLITGTAAMGAVFALATGAMGTGAADAAAVARGMHVTFVVAAGLIAAALAVTARSARQIAALR